MSTYRYSTLSLADIIALHVLTPHVRDQQGVPLLLWGDMSTGKTRSVESVLRYLGYNPYDLNLSTKQPHHLEGLFSIVTEGKTRRTVSAPLGALASVINDKHGALTLNDICTGSESTQKAMMDVVNDRRTPDGAHSFPHAPVIGTSNYDASSIKHPLPPAFGTRFAHYVVDRRESLDWLANRGASSLNPTFIDGQNRIDKEFAGQLNHTSALISGFIRQFPEIASIKVKSAYELIKDPRNYAVPVSRSLESLARTLATCQVFEVNPEQIVTGHIGLEAGRKFTEFSLGLEIPTPEDILQAQGNFGWRALSPSVATIAIQGLAGHVTEDWQVETLGKEWDNLASQLPMGRSLVVPAIQVAAMRMGKNCPSGMSPLSHSHRDMVLGHAAKVAAECKIGINIQDDGIA